MEEFCKIFSIQHIVTSPYYPASNGKAESAAKTLIMSPNKANNSQEFSIAMMTSHDTPPCVNLPTPAELMFGSHIHTHIPPKIVCEQEEECANFVQKHHNKYLKSASKIPTFQLDQMIYFQDPVTKQWFKEITDKWLHSKDFYVGQQIGTGKLYKWNIKYIHSRTGIHTTSFEAPENVNQGLVRSSFQQKQTEHNCKRDITHQCTPAS